MSEVSQQKFWANVEQAVNKVKRNNFLSAEINIMSAVIAGWENKLGGWEGGYQKAIQI